MNFAPIDRRVARTKAALEQALISLILKKGYEATTVEDICAEANVGRSTFYGHFTNKNDLKRSGLLHLRKLLVARQGEPVGQNLNFSLAMFEHAKAHLSLFRALSKGGGADMALGIIRDIVADAVRVELLKRNEQISSNDISREVRVEFIVGAFMSIHNWWLKGGAVLSPQQIDSMFRKMITQGAIDAILPLNP